MVQEKYGVRLATQEKGRLRKMIRAGRSSAQAITRARILIKIDEGWDRPPGGHRTGGVGAEPCSAPSGGMPRKDWTRC